MKYMAVSTSTTGTSTNILVEICENVKLRAATASLSTVLSVANVWGKQSVLHISKLLRVDSKQFFQFYSKGSPQWFKSYRCSFFICIHFVEMFLFSLGSSKHPQRPIQTDFKKDFNSMNTFEPQFTSPRSE